MKTLRKPDVVDDDPVRTEMLRWMEVMSTYPVSPEFTEFCLFFAHDFADGRATQEELEAMFQRVVKAGASPTRKQMEEVTAIVRRPPA